jgi:hypothetical protein
MPINTKRMIAAVAVASAAMGGLAGTVLSSPATAVAQEAEVTGEDTRPGLSDAIQEALSQLVTDNVITQAQADAVTDALVENLPARGAHRGFRAGVHMETVATIIGIDVADLVDALREGSTIAEVASANGSSAAAVVDALVAEANEHIDEAVADGRIAAEDAADIKANAAERIEDMVNGEFEPRGRGFGPGGGRDSGPFGGGEDAGTASDALFGA